MAIDTNYYKAIEGMLYNYKSMQAEIKNIDLEIEEIKNEYTGITGITYEEKSAPTNKFNSSVENEVISKDKKLNYLLKIKAKKENTIKKINNALEVLEEQQLKIIELRYMNNKKLGWFSIADIMQISDVTCRTLKNKAIKAMMPIVFVSVN